MSVQLKVAHGLAESDTDRSARNFSALAANCLPVSAGPLALPPED